MSLLSVRIEDGLKSSADALFKSYGLNLSSGITMFLTKAVRDQRIPFDLDGANAPQSQQADEVPCNFPVGLVWGIERFRDCLLGDAIAVSNDNGKTWNDVPLKDIALGSKIFCLSHQKGKWAVLKFGDCQLGDYVLRLRTANSPIQYGPLNKAKGSWFIGYRDTPSSEIKVAHFKDVKGGQYIYYREKADSEWALGKLKNIKGNSFVSCFVQPDNGWEAISLGDCLGDRIVLHIGSDNDKWTPYEWGDVMGTDLIVAMSPKNGAWDVVPMGDCLGDRIIMCKKTV